MVAFLKTVRMKTSSKWVVHILECGRFKRAKVRDVASIQNMAKMRNARVDDYTLL
jgi:hypothetical protein